MRWLAVWKVMKSPCFESFIETCRAILRLRFVDCDYDTPTDPPLGFLVLRDTELTKKGFQSSRIHVRSQELIQMVVLENCSASGRP